MDLAVFDIDGTLARTRLIDETCYARTFSMAFGIEVAETSTLAYRYSTDSGIMLQVFEEHLGREPTDEERATFQRVFLDLLAEARRRNPDDFVEVPGAADAFARLGREPDWRVAVATGGWRPSALFKLEAIGIAMDGVAFGCANDSMLREEIIRVALARAGETCAAEGFGRVIYVGDGIWDVRAARTLGLCFLGVEGDARGVRLQSEGAVVTVHDFTDYDEFRSKLKTVPVPPPT